MKRITVNKEGFLMTMLELAYNSCYVKNGKARYRDREKDIDARDLVRILIKQHLGEEAPQGDREFVDYISNYLQYEVYSLEGLIAVFYRNVCALADLRERLKEYEDMEESGRLFKMPMKIGDVVYFILQDENDSDAINGFVVSHPHKVIEVGTLGFWTGGTGNYLESADFTAWGELGNNVFLTRAEAEEKLRQKL